jgi:alkylated DNA repair dioxygenase AlkB
MDDAFFLDGFTYMPEFLTVEEHDQLLKIIDGNPFSNAIHRRQQFYGETYYHTTHDLPSIQPLFDASTALQTEQQEEKEEVESNLPLAHFQWLIEKILARKENFFGNDPSNFPTQALVNEYVRNMGIASHYDDAEAFGDVIAMVSLGDPVFMTMRLPKECTNKCLELVDEKKCFIEARSLLVLQRDARYKWRHGIQKTKNLIHPETGEKIHRGKEFRRVSITIRKLLDGRKQSKVAAEPPSVARTSTVRTTAKTVVVAEEATTVPNV